MAVAHRRIGRAGDRRSYRRGRVRSPRTVAAPTDNIVFQVLHIMGPSVVPREQARQWLQARIGNSVGWNWWTSTTISRPFTAYGLKWRWPETAHGQLIFVSATWSTVAEQLRRHRRDGYAERRLHA